MTASAGAPEWYKAMRVAVRAEGEWINAYLADPNTMEGAELIASIARPPMECFPELFQRWCDLLSEIVTSTVQVAIGCTPQIVVEQAPEHEKAGRA